MAGETRGMLAEAIAKVAFDFVVERRNLTERVFWGKPPKNAIVDPDLTIGSDINHPSVLVLINASDNVRNSDMKFWRNISEIFDAKSRISSRPAILNIVFKSEIKPELIRIASVLCDSMHMVDQDPVHGPAISKWLEETHSSAPSKKDGKEKIVRSAIDPESSRYDSNFSKGLLHLVSVLAEKLDVINGSLNSLWEAVTEDYQKHRGSPGRQARTTMLRRGTSRWLVVEERYRKPLIIAYLSGQRVPTQDIPPYAIPLNMLRKTLAGAILDSNTPNGGDMVSTTAYDMRIAAQFFYDAASKNSVEAAASIESTLKYAPDEMKAAAGQLRAMPNQVEAWHQYVIDNWENLVTPEGCYRSLVECWENNIPGNGDEALDEERVWLYDHLVAIMRSAAGRNNDFGYGAMVSYFKARQINPEFTDLLSKVMCNLSGRELTTAQRWVDITLPNSAEPGRRGFQDWLAKKRRITPVIIAAFAYAVAGYLSQIKAPQKIPLPELVARHAYNLWNKILTHQDFEPLAELIQTACKDKVWRVQAPTIFVDLIEDTGQAGYMSAFAFKKGLIMWQSVTDAGKDHKRKELTGRARALRFCKIDNGFGKRPESERLLLVIDGTFSNEDLRILTDSGWDEIFYPDEIDKLVHAVNNA